MAAPIEPPGRHPLDSQADIRPIPRTVAMTRGGLNSLSARVDHLPGRKKDTADALAAVAYHLTHNVKPWTLAGKVEGATLAAVQPELGGTVTPIPYNGHASYMDLVRSERGIGYAD